MNDLLVYNEHVDSYPLQQPVLSAIGTPKYSLCKWLQKKHKRIINSIIEFRKSLETCVCKIIKIIMYDEIIEIVLLKKKKLVEPDL